MAFGKVEDEVSRMPDEAPAGLEEPLLEARQGPTLDGERQDKPAQEIAEIVRDDAQKQPHLIGPEAVAGEARPMGGLFALLDPLLRRPALVVEADESSVRPGERGDDEANPATIRIVTPRALATRSAPASSPEVKSKMARSMVAFVWLMARRRRSRIPPLGEK